ncbi:hypothetical protein E1B28_013176 [Marasmius oreades]|uniref:Uncharacterized protein n=1 Tax=Marasmius oreades TaxID=181124 RepID=A0A9P7RPC8_9AGAR|nr:uncharacterized protein E1B28_013176 [Marasmius oreades]KAG7087195.1 hypothetical protein E1B28_013176 [Marasmius oreades]
MGGKPKPVTCFVETTPQSYESNGFVPTKYHKGGRAEAAKAHKSASSRHSRSTSHTRTSPYPTQFDSSHSNSQDRFSGSSYPTTSSFFPTPSSGDGTSHVSPGISRSSRRPLSRPSATSIPSGYASANHPTSHQVQSYGHSATSYTSQEYSSLLAQQLPSGDRSNDWYPSDLPSHANMGLYPPQHQSSTYPMAQQQQQHFTSHPAWTSSVSSDTSSYHSPYTHQEPTYSVPTGYGGQGGFPPTPYYGGPQGYPSEPVPTWPPYDNPGSFGRYN